MKDLYARLVLLFCSLEKAQLIKTLEMRDAEIAMLRSRVPRKRIFLTNEERNRSDTIRDKCAGSKSHQTARDQRRTPFIVLKQPC